VRRVLLIGATLAFVVAVVGLTWLALCIVAVLHLLERAEAKL
jgi:hypothetical protein